MTDSSNHKATMRSAPPVYLDYAATTPVDRRVAAKMIPYLTDLRGTLIPAGVLIRSMSAIAGINGMAIDVQANNLLLEAITVTLHVTVDDPSDASAVRVQVLCGNRVPEHFGLQTSDQRA